jgi:glucan-binding YG repeat protein
MPVDSNGARWKCSKAIPPETEDVDMRLLTSVSIGVLSLLMGIPAAMAQDDAKPHPEDAKPEQNDVRPQQNPASQVKDQDKQEMKQDQNQAPKDEKPSKEEKQQEKDQAKAAKQGQTNQTQASQASGNHAQPAGGQSGRIPDKDFKAHFGRQHTLVINQTTIVQGQSRFQYAGYWFALSDPWPAGWAYTDTCYIDYVDGEYILFDLLHPGVQVVLVVVVA